MHIVVSAKLLRSRRISCECFGNRRFVAVSRNPTHHHPQVKIASDPTVSYEVSRQCVYRKRACVRRSRPRRRLADTQVHRILRQSSEEFIAGAASAVQNCRTRRPQTGGKLRQRSSSSRRHDFRWCVHYRMNAGTRSSPPSVRTSNRE